MKCKTCGRFSSESYCSDVCHPKRSDDLSYFRYALKNMRNRAKKKKMRMKVTINDLDELWKKQDGKCPYTGWDLKKTKVRAYDQASLDRINSDKGYIKGNVVWVSYMAQNAKNSHTEKELIEFCKAVYEKHNKPPI